jgi:hypothetical protein
VWGGLFRPSKHFTGKLPSIHAQLGIRKEDVFINLVETAKENWSFGNGIAQYVVA